MSSFSASRDYSRRSSRDTTPSLDLPSGFAMTSTQLPLLSSSHCPRKNTARESLSRLSFSSNYFPEEPEFEGSPTDPMPQQPSRGPRSVPSATSLFPQARFQRHSVPRMSSGSTEMPLPGSLSSAGPCSIKSDLVNLRSPSTETVKGPTSNQGSPSPLTGFPPWGDESGGDCEPRGWRDVDHEGQRAARQRRDSARDVFSVALEAEGRWILSSVLHAVVLVLQFTAALAVFSALLWIAVWKKKETDVEFWEWLWKYAEPSLVGVLLLCSITLLAHEVKILSSVALLYLQSAILIFTTAASIAMWVRCFGESSRIIKGVLMGCNVLMWGLALFGFVRAVVIWKVEYGTEQRDRRFDGHCSGARCVSYGTFVPWAEVVRGHDTLPR